MQNPSPGYLESTLKCNNERGNKLIIPISRVSVPAALYLLSSDSSQGLLGELRSHEHFTAKHLANISLFCFFPSVCLNGFEIRSSAPVSVLPGGFSGSSPPRVSLSV